MSSPSSPHNKNLSALVQNHRALKVGQGKPIVCLEGSARSGKTWAILDYVVDCCECLPGFIATCFRFDGTTHERTTIRDFRSVLATREEAWTGWHDQKKCYTWPNGSVLEFGATNEPGKLQGGPRDLAWLNEAMEIPEAAYNQISIRTRRLTLFDWNPSFSHHWIYDRILTRGDVLYVHSTYQDNPHLTPQQVREIEKYDPSNPANVRAGTADEWQWSVYGLGQRGRREGVIFRAWDIVDDWPAPDLCQRWGFGLDFGFSDDPSALIECAYAQGDLYLREIVYERDLIVGRSASMPSAPSLVGRMEDAKLPRNRARVHADGARPDLIRELALAGWQVGSADKRPGSVLAGLNLLRGLRIHVARQSQNIQRELEAYAWRRNKTTGEWYDEPEDANNHAIDAVRYWAMAEIRSHQATAAAGQVATKAKTFITGRRRP